VIGAYTGCNAEFEVLGLLDEISGEVSWVERSSDKDIGSNDFLLEDAVWTLFAAADNELVALLFEPGRDAETVLSGTQEPGLFSCGLATVVENAQDLHVFALVARVVTMRERGYEAM